MILQFLQLSLHAYCLHNPNPSEPLKDGYLKLSLMEIIKLPPTSFSGPSVKPPQSLLAGFPTACFRGLFREHFCLRCFRGSSAKGISSLLCHPSKFGKELPQAKCFHESFRELLRAQWEPPLFGSCRRPISDVISVSNSRSSNAYFLELPQYLRFRVC